MSPKVVGIDLSLTSTGFAQVNSSTAEVFTIVSKGKADDGLYSRRDRLTQIQQQIIAKCGSFNPDLITIESPAFSKVQGHAHDRSGLWWLIVEALTVKWPLAEINPNLRSKFATGKGNAGKDAVLIETTRRYPGVPFKNNNEVDAYLLALMGMRRLGNPLEDLPQLYLDSMKTIRWPEGI